MRTFIHGNDEGNIMLLAVVFILVSSLIIVSVIPYITQLRDFGEAYKERVLTDIHTRNGELINQYDLY
jgi:hypothetical protein